MTKAIIFDCWNTLYFTDLTPHHFVVFAEKLGKNIHDYNFLKIFEKHFMLEKHHDLRTPIKQILNELKIDFDAGLVTELQLILENGLKHIRSYPETKEILDKLKEEYKLGIITNTWFSGFQLLAKKFDLNNHFNVILKSYETGLLKPNPKIFEMMLKELNVDKNEVFMVGDSLKDDVEAAEKFGIKAILIDRKNKYPNYPNRIVSLKQLPKLL